MTESPELLPHLRETLVFLAVTGLLVPVLQRLKIPPILGFLVAGVLIGPYGLAQFAGEFPLLNHIVISDVEGVRTLADLGIVFLLFSIGLELSFQRIRQMQGQVFGLGGLQVVLTATAIGGITLLSGLSLGHAMVIGLSLALSSTAIVMQMLTEQGRIATQSGRASLAVLLLQDLAVIPILFLVNALAGDTTDAGLALLFALIKAIVAVAAIVVLGRVVMRPLYRFIGVPWNPEVFMAVTLLVVLGTAWATSTAGMSMALGAFLAGLLLAETEYRHQIEADIGPFKGLLLGLFFVSVGMGIDLRVLIANFWPILGAVAGVLAIKSLILFCLGMAFRLPRGAAIELGCLMSPVSEFAFVVVGVAVGSGVLSGETGSFLLLVTGLTMLLAPVLANLGNRIARHVGAEDFERHGESARLGQERGHIVIAGYGRVGALLGRLLQSQHIPYVALDLDAVAVANLRSDGSRIYYADASRPDVLRRVNAGAAKALVVTTDDPYAAEAVVRTARRNWPELSIYARARDQNHARQLVMLGATSAVPENFEASLQLAQQTLEATGLPSNTARSLCDELRASRDQP